MSEAEDRAAQGGHARYGGDGHPTGSNQPRDGERKQQSPTWVGRQGGAQRRETPAELGEAGKDRGAGPER
jgi:hypothetical protein